MLDELVYDQVRLQLHISPYLSGQGVHDYPHLLQEAIAKYDEKWLAARLNERRRIERTHTRRKPKGGYTIAAVPHNAAQVIADGEFNRYYIRGLCRRAIADKIDRLIVYRARASENPRPSSSRMESRTISAKSLLTDLQRPSRAGGPRFGIPAGPNSSLSVRLPQLPLAA